MKPDFGRGTFRPQGGIFAFEESRIYKGFEGSPGPNESGAGYSRVSRPRQPTSSGNADRGLWLRLRDSGEGSVCVQSRNPESRGFFRQIFRHFRQRFRPLENAGITIQKWR